MKKTIRDFDLKGKRVIIRSDLNVSLKDGKILDDNRIIESVSTIKYALDNGAKVIILSHLGKIKIATDKSKYSLKVVYERLNELLDNRLSFVNETRGLAVLKAVNDLEFGRGLLLENTRFEDIDGTKESKNNSELAQCWANLGDIFINDAFGTLHREHASNVGISSLLDSGIGLLVEKELSELNKLDNPLKPFVIIMGGSKVSDKLGVISCLINKADKMLIGGGMAFTFLKAKGVNVGKSLVEEEQLDNCRGLLQEYGDKLVLPIDFKVANEFIDSPALIVEEIKNYQMGLDIGPKTIKLFLDNLGDVKTCFWNGPLGAYELSNYQEGTKKVMEGLFNCYTILGGGDIVTCANLFGYKDRISFLSTGGGASLKYLENKNLPGLKYIKEK